MGALEESLVPPRKKDVREAMIYKELKETASKACGSYCQEACKEEETAKWLLMLYNERKN